MGEIMVTENKIIPVAKKIIRITDKRSGFGAGYRPDMPGRRKKKDRRKTPYDRRRSVRDGVIVELSFQDKNKDKKDRRKNPDRRFQVSDRPVSTVDTNASDYDIIA